MPRVRSPKTNLQAPNESQPKFMLFGHFRMARGAEAHLGNLYTIQRKDTRVRMDPFQGLRVYLT